MLIPMPNNNNAYNHKESIFGAFGQHALNHRKSTENISQGMRQSFSLGNADQQSSGNNNQDGKNGVFIQKHKYSITGTFLTNN